jgi:hypothetical protein
VETQHRTSLQGLFAGIPWCFDTSGGEGVPTGATGLGRGRQRNRRVRANEACNDVLDNQVTSKKSCRFFFFPYFWVHSFEELLVLSGELVIIPT